MTFKDIRIWSRSMTYRELASCNVRALNNRDFKTAFAYNSIMRLNSFNTCNPHSKIRNWKYAILAYRIYKNYKENALMSL